MVPQLGSSINKCSLLRGMSALGHKRTFAVQNGDVRFTPKSGHVQCNSACPLCANSGHSDDGRTHEKREITAPALAAIYR